jgi:hypothetical protein
MQADKSVLCAQAVGASQETANTALMQAVRTQAETQGVDGRGVMKKVPEVLNVSDCAPANVQRQAGTRPKAWPLEERM